MSAWNPALFFVCVQLVFQFEKCVGKIISVAWHHSIEAYKGKLPPNLSLTNSDGKFQRIV